MADVFINSVFASFRALGQFLLAVVSRIPSLLINPGFIVTFLVFTLLVWIGMSGDDREPISSFSRAGVIAFIATVFIFVMAF